MNMSILYYILPVILVINIINNIIFYLSEELTKFLIKNIFVKIPKLCSELPIPSTAEDREQAAE